uniref:Kinesin-associated protein 3 n=1 Tax=Zooxanthella nutricula TaxID=1333877 RepID=A0A7S2KAC1_9DINO
MEHKVNGAKRILRVCTDVGNLEAIADHDTLLGVLSRELKENAKRSFELSVAIACTFLCFSHFSQFHPVLMHHQCGNVIMKVFEYESDRYQVRKGDMERRKMRFQELGETATAEDKRLLLKDEKKYRIQLSRQSKLIHVCLMALLNLAEEITTEKKMVNRKMPELLTQLLDRGQDDLLLAALGFMKKLSVFEDNKDLMSNPETLTRLVHLASHENVRIALLALRVLFNFSFDEALRSSLIESGIVKLLVDLLRNPPFRHIVLRLLYHFSMDDRCKSIMAYHRDGMIMLLQLVVHFPEARVGKDLVALVVNLATHPRAAEVMVGSGMFQAVMQRVTKTRDPLLSKVIRHVTSHPSALGQMMEVVDPKWTKEFVMIASKFVDDPDLLVELLGSLVNLTVEDANWGDLCEAGLVETLTRLLVSGFSEDDVVLECVMLVGNLANQHESAQYVGGSRLPGLLQQVLVDKQQDEEIVVQLLYTFQCLMLYEDVREHVLQETHLPTVVMRFARHSNAQVLEQATRTLQMVADHTGEGGSDWAEQVKAFRFEQHNSEWCRAAARDLSGSVSMSPGGYGFYDEHQSGAEEEEFAYRCANGYAMDAGDLADRDWGNQDVEQLMHTSRHMSIS